MLPSAVVADEPLRLVFDEITGVVQQEFYDKSVAVEEFPQIAARYREQLIANPGRDFAELVNRMLGELNASHTHYYTPDDYGYQHLAAIFQFIKPIRALYPDGVTYTTAGIITEVIDGKTFIVSVLSGSRAEEAGLQSGDEIVSADGQPFGPVSSFRGKAGQPVKLLIRRTADGPVEPVSVRPEELEPKAENLAAEKESVRVVDVQGVKIAYIHVWSYAGTEYQEVFEDALLSPDVRQADALIWDLRFGWGGANVEYLRVFSDDLPKFVVIDREGESKEFETRLAQRADGSPVREYPLWTKPAVMLTNRRVRSGKELLAHGFKSREIGSIVGESTMGATLGGRLFVLSNDAILYVAVMDTRIDGERLEGQGVKPDIVVPHDVRYTAGADPQYDRAVDLLVEELRPATPTAR